MIIKDSEVFNEFRFPITELRIRILDPTPRVAHFWVPANQNENFNLRELVPNHLKNHFPTMKYNKNQE